MTSLSVNNKYNYAVVLNEKKDENAFKHTGLFLKIDLGYLNILKKVIFQSRNQTK